MHHPRPLPLRVLPTPHERLEGARRVGEGAHALTRRVVGVDEGPVKGHAGISARKKQRVGFAGLEGLVVEGGHLHALLEGRDAVVGVVWVVRRGRLGVCVGWDKGERGDERNEASMYPAFPGLEFVTGTTARLLVTAVVGERVDWKGRAAGGARSGHSPLALKARSVFLSNMVKGINCPRLLGIPSGTGLQKYAGINEPFVKA